MFPFKHKGKTYKSCATPSDGNGPYCATKVDSNGNMVNDKWARCNDYCDTEKGEIIVRIIMKTYIKYFSMYFSRHISHM